MTIGAVYAGCVTGVFWGTVTAGTPVLGGEAVVGDVSAVLGLVAGGLAVVGAAVGGGSVGGGVVC